MTTAQLEVSILAAPLAAMDPRALSQAWYSALRLARPERSPESVARTRIATAPAALTARTHVLTVSREPFAPFVPDRARAKTGHAISDQTFARASGRRVLESAPLAERIERTFSHPQLKRATFSIGRSGARVHVILQTNGNTATLIALCRPEMRAVVARALVQVRLALARRGIALDLEAKGVRACF